MKMKEKRRVEDCTSSQRWPSSDQSLCHEQIWECNVTAFLSVNGFDTLRFNYHTLTHRTWFLAWPCRNKYFWQSTILIKVITSRLLQWGWGQENMGLMTWSLLPVWWNIDEYKVRKISWLSNKVASHRQCAQTTSGAVPLIWWRSLDEFEHKEAFELECKKGKKKALLETKIIKATLV